jgi:hypothetical protein
MNQALHSSRAENEEQEDAEKQQVNTALQNARFAAAEGDDANAKGEKEEGEISTLET